MVDTIISKSTEMDCYPSPRVPYIYLSRCINIDNTILKSIFFFIVDLGIGCLLKFGPLQHTCNIYMIRNGKSPTDVTKYPIKCRK